MTFLNVPYAEKDQARELGARWNPVKKRWYVPPGVALEPFERWLNKDGAPGSRDARAAAPVVGKRYQALEHDCNPFEPCAQCARALEESGWNAARAEVIDALGKARR